ncbi:MAG: protoporphyrinogen oxidase [Gemmataceae bacterium]|nr:protoporphyrinogen oxidase [Gemmataceae bacterium]
MKRLVIVGAGISGLAAAFRLQQIAPTIEITVLEQRERVGGNAWTARREGFQVEIGPNGFLDNKPTTMALCRDLGLGERLIAATEAAGRNRYLFVDGRLRALPGSFKAFVTSDLLSWRGKLNFLMERFRGRGPDRDESVDAFARRRAGREVAEVFADALVTGIHGGDPALLSIRAAFPRIATLEKQFGSVMKGLAASARQRRADAKARGEAPPRPGRMWSFREGLRLLMETLRNRLSRPPLAGVAVCRIEKQADGTWIVQGDGNDRWSADAVLLTCPAYQQAAIVQDVDRELADQLGRIAYNRIAVVALGFRRDDVRMPLDGFGYIAPQRDRRDLLGVQWCSSIFPERAPEGRVLFRALCGGWHRAEVVGWDDDRLIRAVRAELRLAMRVEAVPCYQHVVRWDRAIPQYHVGHQQRVADIEERAALHKGLFLGGNAYHGVALNDCTEQAEVLARQLSQYLV